MSKIITDDCIKSFITNHYGTTDISTIGDGTVTGAISTLNTNINTFMNDLQIGRWFEPTPKSDYLVEGCCVQMGKIVLCNFTVKLKQSNTVLYPEHNWTLATGFPVPSGFIEIAGVHARQSGAQDKSVIISCTLTDNALTTYYPSDAYITNTSGVFFSFAYRCK